MKKVINLVLFAFVFLLINVNNVYASISMDCDDIKIGLNKSQTISISGSEGNVTWSSSDTSIVSVNGGIITGNALGSAYISASDASSTANCKVTVISDYVAVTGLTISNSDATIGINETLRINTVITPNNATNKEVTYASSDSNVASIDASGIVTGKKAGTTYITASLEGRTASLKVTVVSNVALKEITVSPSTVTLDEGKTSKLTVNYNPSNATNKKVTWKSSNTSVVTVDDSGNLKGISSGSATITIISNDGGKVATVKVTVNAADTTLKGISLNKTELTLEVGKSETLTVSYDPVNASKKGVTWRSSKSSVVSVEEGKITAIKPGSAEITVTSDEGDFKAICKVKVPSPPIESIKFSSEEINVSVGETITLETISTPEDAIIEDAIWTSSDETIATVSDGELTALEIGTTEVTVSDKEGKIKASIKINVIEKEEEDLAITIDGYDINFNKDIKEYTLTINDESSLKINVNRDSKLYKIAGNRDLQNGSIITVTITEDKKDITYIINIKKKTSYMMYFAGVIGLLIVINLIRIVVNNKKKKDE